MINPANQRATAADSSSSIGSVSAAALGSTLSFSMLRTAVRVDCPDAELRVPIAENFSAMSVHASANARVELHYAFEPSGETIVLKRNGEACSEGARQDVIYLLEKELTVDLQLRR